MRYSFRSTRINLIKVKLILSVLILFSFVFIGFHQWIGRQSDETIIYEPVVVLNGDTLWKLAQHSSVDTDIRNTILKIMNYNYLENSTIHPGQVIYIPMKTSQLADAK